MLTGEAHLAPLRAIPRLAEALHAAGVAGIARPACPGCHRVVRIDTPLDGVRVCRTCVAHSRARQCARCGARREPATRDDQGRPLCANCLVTDPANLETCTGCGRRRRVQRRTPHGPLCSSCPTLPLLTCSVCGQITPCGISRATGLPWCPACQRRTAACSACGRVAPITSGTWPARCRRLHPAPGLGRLPGLQRPRPSQPRPVRPLPDQHAPGRADGSRRRLPAARAAGPAPRARRGRLPRHGDALADQPVHRPVLAGLAAGRIPLTHQALDGLPQTRALAHLRQTLVAVGALPGRDEEMARLEAFLAALIDAQPGTGRRQLLHRYLTWHLVRRLRSRNDGQPATRQQARKIRRLARGAVAFLDWLDAHDLTLGSCQQADLDRWLADEHAGYREEAGRLIRWARASKLTTGHLTAAPWNGPAQLIDHQHRWDTARRLLHDGAIRPEDRLAGLLVLLYAQGATAISQMTAGQIQASDDSVRLRLGRVPIHLPEPAATIARTVLANRKGQAAIGARQPSPWLFPGGQPGRPISADGLTRRLNDARHPPRPGPQHRLVPARRRDPGRHPRPHPGHQHQGRRHLATPRRRRLDHLRRRHQPTARHHQGRSLMASWLDLDQAAPHITRAGHALLNQARVALLGTLRPDGSPRISPVEPYFTDGQLIFGLMTWSGKARDLRRDPRCVLHTTISGPDAGEPELKLYGLTAAAGDQLRNACRQAWWTGQPRAAADVFLLEVTQAVLIEWDLQRGQMTSTHWSPGRGLWQQARSYP